LVRPGDAQRHGLLGVAEPGVDHTRLLQRDAKLGNPRLDGLPRQVVPDGQVEFFQPLRVRGQEDEHVAVGALGGAARFQARPREAQGRRVVVPPDVRVRRSEDDQPRLLGVGHVPRVRRGGVDAGEVSAVARLVPETGLDLGPHVLGVQPLGVVLGGATHRRLDVVPVALPDDVR
jgi:hypothetical protein